MRISKYLIALAVAVGVTAFARTGIAAADDQFGATGVADASALPLRDFLCAMGPYGLTTDSHATISDAGNVTLICNTTTATPPDRAERQFEGVPCSVFVGVTTDSYVLVSPNGNVKLYCTLKVNP